MKKLILKFSLLIGIAIVICSSLKFGKLLAKDSEDSHPCKPKREAKHSVRKSLEQCIKAWAQDRKPTDVDPADDCSAKLTGFIQSAKELKTCVTERKKEMKH